MALSHWLTELLWRSTGRYGWEWGFTLCNKVYLSRWNRRLNTGPYTTYCVGDAAAFVETFHWTYLDSFFLFVFYQVLDWHLVPFFFVDLWRERSWNYQFVEVTHSSFTCYYGEDNTMAVIIQMKLHYLMSFTWCTYSQCMPRAHPFSMHMYGISITFEPTRVY